MAASALPGVVAVVVLLAALELVVRVDILPARWFPPVSEIFRELWREASTSRFWDAMRDTMKSWATGLGLSFIIAVPLGLAIGSNRKVYDAVKLVIEFLRPIPSVALIPLAVLVWGAGEETKLFLIVFAASWPLLFQAIYGVQDVDPVARDTARSFGFGRLARWRYVTIPSTLPYIATGLRIASAIALLLAVGTELIVGAPGLGHEIGLAQSAGATRQMYAYIVATGLLGLIVNLAVAALERSMLHWHTSQRPVAV